MARRNSTTSAVTAEAIERLCARNYHQCFRVPANERLGHGRLRVTYATTSNFGDESLPAVLLFSAMFGGRYSLLALDHMAMQHSVRIVCPDRPGLGGSTPVPLAIRMATWLGIVPALLGHLRVEHVHLMSHSAGTMYLLNTLYDQRGALLDGRETYVGMMGPWVHNEHSQVALLSWASKLPNGMLDSWNGLVKTINQRIAPSISWSGGAFSAIAGMFTSAGAKVEPASDGSMAKLLGVSNELAKEMERLQGKFFFEEDTSGSNEDARLCLKMGGTALWGNCEDYADFIRMLAKEEQDRKDADTTNSGLKIRVFYAESDVMIGKGGQKYFEECWAQEGVAGPIDYEGRELPGTNHETVFMDGEKGALPIIFAAIARMPR